MALLYPVNLVRLFNLPSFNTPGVYLRGTAFTQEGRLYFDRKLGRIAGTDPTKETLITYEVFSKDNKQLNITEINNLLSTQNSFPEGQENILITSNIDLSYTMRQEYFGLINFTSPEGIVEKINKQDYLQKVTSGDITTMYYYETDEVNEYLKSSAPVMVNVGLDTYNDGLNPLGRSSGEMDQAGQLNALPLSSILIGFSITEGADGGPIDTRESNDVEWENTIYDAWGLSYVSKRNISRGVTTNAEGDVLLPESVEPIIINHETNPWRIRFILDGGFSTEALEGLFAGSIAQLPNLQLWIELDTPATLPIKVMDRVKLLGEFENWPHEFTVVDIEGEIGGITRIYLDIFYPKDISANSFANENTEIGYLNGKDHFSVGVTNKVALLPAPFEMRVGDGQAYTDNIVEAYSFQEAKNMEINFIWENDYDGYSHKTHEILSSYYCDYKGVGSDIKFSRPISTEAQSNIGFTNIEFKSNDIEVIIDENETISMFPTYSPRSPEQPSIGELYFDKAPQSGVRNRGFQDGAGFRNAPGKFTGPNNTLATSVPQAVNTTLQMKHGQWNTNRSDGAWPQVNDSNAKPVAGQTSNVSLPLLRGGIGSAASYVQLTLLTDSEFYLVQKQQEIALQTGQFYRIRVDIEILNYGNFDNYDVIDLELAPGLLDKSNNNGTIQKTFTESENTYFSTQGQLPLDTDITLYSKIFTAKTSPQSMLGKFYLYVNATGFYKQGATYNEQGLTIRLNGYEVEVLDDVAMQAESPDLELDTVNTPVYKYLVLQWGDEKNLLTDEQIKETFYFSYYDEDEDDTAITISKAKNLYNSLTKAKYIKSPDSNNVVQNNLYSHYYTESGLKNLKIILFRLNNDETQLLETKLLQSNLIINDGSALTRDFEIFGGSDFTLLPLGEREAIIGGMDKESNYVESLVKLTNDNLFDNDELIIKKSANLFNEKFQNDEYGVSPSNLDLSTTRVFNKPIDIYDLLSVDRSTLVDNEFNLDDVNLPINSAATDIFINNEDCIIDINPQNIEFLTIPNKQGVEDKGILLGDYKVKKPSNSKIKKENIMDVALLDINKDKQAF